MRNLFSMWFKPRNTWLSVSNLMSIREIFSRRKLITRTFALGVTTEHKITRIYQGIDVEGVLICTRCGFVSYKSYVNWWLTQLRAHTYGTACWYNNIWNYVTLDGKDRESLTSSWGYPRLERTGIPTYQLTDTNWRSSEGNDFRNERFHFVFLLDSATFDSSLSTFFAYKRKDILVMKTEDGARNHRRSGCMLSLTELGLNGNGNPQTEFKISNQRHISK